MFDYLTHLIRLRKDRRGVTAIEYALIASLVAVILIGALGTLGNDIATSFQLIGTTITNATNNAGNK
jgi:pilus assembly protein Flp/PilA